MQRRQPLGASLAANVIGAAPKVVPEVPSLPYPSFTATPLSRPIPNPYLLDRGQDPSLHPGIATSGKGSKRASQRPPTVLSCSPAVTRYHYFASSHSVSRPVSDCLDISLT